MGKVVGEQGLALQQHFPYIAKSSQFLENSNCPVNLLLTPGAINLVILVFPMHSFHFWHSLSYSPQFKIF